MKCLMSKEYVIGPSDCDHSAKLSLPAAFDIFMDIAAEHAESLGIGTTFMFKEHKFWLTAKTRVKVMRRPRMTEKVVLNTWPLKPRGVQDIRDYAIRSMSGEDLVLGKTQWAVLDTDTGALAKIGELFSNEWELETETVLEGPFSRINEDISDCSDKGSYVVRSIDIDLGGHMNNVAYVRALFGAFSSDELDKMNLTECEICYKNSCYEGDKLSFYRRDIENGTEIVARKDDGSTAILAKLR